MPFDGTQTAPSLRLLSEILRDQKRWPEGFEWNYSRCETCALGLASELWGMTVYNVALRLNIPTSFAFAAFLNAGGPWWSGPTKPHLVKPRHVADAIDAFLAERERG